MASYRIEVSASAEKQIRGFGAKIRSACFGRSRAWRANRGRQAPARSPDTSTCCASRRAYRILYRVADGASGSSSSRSVIGGRATARCAGLRRRPRRGPSLAPRVAGGVEIEPEAWSQEERLGEASEHEKLPEIHHRFRSDLPERERMEAKQVIPSLERIAAVAVEVETRAPRDEDALPRVAGVEETLEAPQRRTCGSRRRRGAVTAAARPAGCARGARGCPSSGATIAAGQAPRECRLADPAGASDEHHLSARSRFT